MIIGLFGIYGVYNFGCEAIVRGAVNFINTAFPGSKILYFSYNYKYDRAVLSDLQIDVCEVQHSKSIPKKIINRIQTAFGIEHRCLLFDYSTMLESVDAIFSIGGDIYTIPAVNRQHEKYPYYNTLVNFCSKACAMGKPVVVYGASVGPWGDYSKAVHYYVSNMKKYRAILCREKKSEDYLTNLGFENVKFFPDPAFQVNGKNTIVAEKKYIGVNLSPLSFAEIYGSNGLNIHSELAKLMDEIVDTFNRDLMFVPHVISPNKNDNDYVFMKDIKEAMANRERVYCANYQNGFLGIKEQLKQCQVVVAARMHCAINAVHENIPAIFLSYSQKSVGMCQYIYGNTDYLIDLKSINLQLIKKIHTVLEQRESVVEQLTIRNKEIYDYYCENIEELKSYFDRLKSKD